MFLFSDNHSIGLLAQLKRAVCSFYSSLLHLSYDTYRLPTLSFFLVYWSQQTKQFIGNFRLSQSGKKVLCSSRSRTSSFSCQAGKFKKVHCPTSKGVLILKQAISSEQIKIMINLKVSNSFSKNDSFFPLYYTTWEISAI